MVDEFATDVGSLISVLQKLKPEQRVIGETCKAMLHIVETTEGSVLIVEADKRFSRSPISAVHAEIAYFTGTLTDPAA